MLMPKDINLMKTRRKCLPRRCIDQIMSFMSLDQRRSSCKMYGETSAQYAWNKMNGSRRGKISFGG
jgi:hypothetical protein